MKTVIMIAAVATSALLVTPTVATAATPLDGEPTTIVVSAVGLDRSVSDKRLARAVDRYCAEREMRGADRAAMEALCAESFTGRAAHAQLASVGSVGLSRRG